MKHIRNILLFITIIFAFVMQAEVYQNMLWSFNGAYYLSSRYTTVNSQRAYAMNRNGVPEKKREQIEKKLSAMTEKLKNNKPHHVGLGIKANFAFMRMLHTKCWDSSPTEAEYRKEKGWLGKVRPWKK